jgi:DNA polymerase III delta prime subunit
MYISLRVSSRIYNQYSRGIDVVRNKIKSFAQKKVTLPPGRHKIIILDEADRLGCIALNAVSPLSNIPA